MKFIQTKFKEVQIIERDKFTDFRGEFSEIYNKEIYIKHGIKIDFITDSISYSNKNVLRGLHGDFNTWKLMTCVDGKIFIIIVNNIDADPNFKQWISLELSKTQNNSLILPPGYGVGYYVKSEKAAVHYKQSTIYKKNQQFTIKWNDANYSFKWPVKDPILSERDN